MRLKPLAAMAFLFAAVFVVLQVSASENDENGENGDAGKDLFTELRCQSCHSIQSLDLLARGDRVRDDLSEVGKSRDAEWLKRYLQRDESLELGDVAAHRVPFRGSDEQLESLTAWLADLGTE